MNLRFTNVCEDGESNYHMTFDLDPHFQGQIQIFARIFITNADIIMILSSTCRFMNIADQTIV